MADFARFFNLDDQFYKMSEYTLPYFESIDTDDLDGNYDAEIPINNLKVPTTIFFDEPSIESSKMDDVKSFLENLNTYDTRNRGFIRQDFFNPKGDTARYYLKYHLENLDKDTLKKLFDGKDLVLNEELLNKLLLVRLAIYPHSEEYLAIFDYSFGAGITNQLLVLSTDKDENFHFMDMES